MFTKKMILVADTNLQMHRLNRQSYSPIGLKQTEKSLKQKKTRNPTICHRRNIARARKFKTCSVVIATIKQQQCSTHLLASAKLDRTAINTLTFVRITTWLGNKHTPHGRRQQQSLKQGGIIVRNF